MDKLLSIIIPAFNEENRLPKTLGRLLDFLNENKIDFEIIVVNDGSRDDTAGAVRDFSAEDPRIKLISHFPNHGRGASVREGVLAAVGSLILETDSDGSVADEAILRFIHYFNDHKDVDMIFGSRELPDSEIAYSQPFFRVFLGYGFIYLSKFLLWSWNTTDFTLGFKMFRSDAAKDIFSHQYDDHYVAEAEIVYVGRLRGWVGRELAVHWTDNRDSRVHPVRDSIRSFNGILKLLYRRIKGLYR